MKWIKRKVFCENLTEAISLAEIDVTLKVMLNSTNEVALFRIPWRSSLRGNWPIELQLLSYDSRAQIYIYDSVKYLCRLASSIFLLFRSFSMFPYHFL